MKIYKLTELRKLLTDQEYLIATSTIFDPIRYNDWKEFIPQDIRDWWGTLSLETRLIGYLIAKHCYIYCEEHGENISAAKFSIPETAPKVQFDDIDTLPGDNDFIAQDLEEDEDE